MVREASVADLPALLELERLCFPGASAYDESEYLEMLLGAGTINLVVAEGTGVVAFGSALVEPRRGEGHIITVNVHPGHRGRGLARRLMSVLEARLAAHGVRRVRLEVNVANKDAIRLYEAGGYTRRGRLAGYYSTYEEPDAFVYEKTL